jgi:hypothetical protein
MKKKKGGEGRELKDTMQKKTIKKEGKRNCTSDISMQQDAEI